MKMHRFPKLFSLSSERRKSRADSSSSRRPAKPKRLERSYALRNVNYEFSPSSSASSSSHSPEESQRARSLDLYGGKTSFRVDGTEGELAVICEAFGFSGIEDFAISPEEYEAMKVASSPGMVSKKLESVVDCDEFVNYPNGNGRIETIDEINRKMECLSVANFRTSSGLASKNLGESCDFGDANRGSRAYVLDEGVSQLSNSKGLENGVHFNEKFSVRSRASRRNGIKGVRPTIVLPTRDTSTGFLLESDPCIPKIQSRFFSNKGETEVNDRNRREQEKDMVEEENSALSESSSFSSNEDDSSGSMTEPMSSISSNERYGRVIHDWQKGELLGRGTFGSVYEGIAE